MNRTFLKVVIFTFVVLMVFMYVGHLLTEISGTGTGPVVAVGVSPEAGETIFWGKGKCHTCHSIGTRGSAVRGPNLGVNDKFTEPAAIRAGQRKEGYDAISYLVESLYDPNAHVVKGFSKGVMKPVNRPPIALEDEQIQATIIYLMSFVGEVSNEVYASVDRAQLPYKTGKVQVEEVAQTLKIPEGDAEEGRYVFEDMKCYQCHKIVGEEFPIDKEEEGVGPDLNGIGDVQTLEYLVESILNPNAIIIQGKGYTGDDGLSKMPEYHDTLTIRGLLDIAAYLSSLKTGQTDEKE